MVTDGTVARVTAVSGAAISGYGFYLSVREGRAAAAAVNAVLLAAQLAVVIAITFVKRIGSA